MKYINIFFLFALMSVTIKAQNVDSQKKRISMIILDKKERPMSNIVVRSLSSTKAGLTDRSGVFVFADMSGNDTISMMLPNYGEIFIPVVGKDSIVVKLRSARRYYYASYEEQNVVTEGLREFNHKHKVEPIDLLDVQEMLSKHHYNSLTDLLQGVAGLNLTPHDGFLNTSANMRGPTSLYGSNEPLVVLDGVRMGSFSQAEKMINIYDIKTIEVQKNATQWGAFGANGAIVIKTK